MARKYCPICYYEFHEKVGLKENGNGNTRPMDWEDDHKEPKREYKCTKRGHHSKGSGLSIHELEKLVEFRRLDL